MTFRNPELAALAPLMVLVFALALSRHWHRVRKLQQAYDAGALGRLLPRPVASFPRARFACLVLAGAAVGLAAAGPIWVAPGEEPTPPLDLALVVDLSLSMGAADAAPSRIARARTVVARLTEELPSARLSLITFAGWPYVLVPPTDDASIVRYFADSLRVELVRERDRGSQLGEALWMAQTTLDARSREDARRAILVVSDGGVEAQADVAATAADLASSGIEIWTAGIGSREGAVIFAGGEPVLEGGEPVTAAFDTDLLRAVAEAGGGSYRDVTDDSGLDGLAESLRELSGDASADAQAPLDATFILVLFAIPLLLWDGASDAGRVLTLGRKRDLRS